MFAPTETPKSLPIETHIVVLRQRLGAIHLPNSGDHAKMSPCLGFSQQTDFTKILLLIGDFEGMAFANGGTSNRRRYTIRACGLIIIDVLIFPTDHGDICIRTGGAIKRTRWGEGIRGVWPPPRPTVNIIIDKGINDQTSCGGQEESIPGMIW